MAGEEFNINSPKQLSKILFEKLKLPIIRRTKTGISTESAFELLAVNDAFATGLFVTDAATKAPASSASPRDVQTALGETQMRFRDYAGDRIWEQGMKMIIAGAQLTLGLPPV